MTEDGCENLAVDQVAGVIVAGGQSRRWGGGDKFLAAVGGKILLRHVIDRVRRQVRMLILNANSPAPEYGGLGMTTIPDNVTGDRGPLAGVLTGLDWVRENLPGVKWVMTVPSDAPFLPTDLAARLLASVTDEGADMGCVMSGGRTHPVIGLWPVALCDQLRHDLTINDVRKVDAWTANYKIAYPAWSVEPVDPFFNINTRDDLEVAETLIAEATA
jgi:molybdenum cofactor guanylyltransferase